MDDGKSCDEPEFSFAFKGLFLSIYPRIRESKNIVCLNIQLQGNPWQSFEVQMVRRQITTENKMESQ